MGDEIPRVGRRVESVLGGAQGLLVGAQGVLVGAQVVLGTLGGAQVVLGVPRYLIKGSKSIYYRSKDFLGIDYPELYQIRVLRMSE